MVNDVGRIPGRRVADMSMGPDCPVRALRGFPRLPRQDSNPDRWHQKPQCCQLHHGGWKARPAGHHVRSPGRHPTLCRTEPVRRDGMRCRRGCGGGRDGSWPKGDGRTGGAPVGARSPDGVPAPGAGAWGSGGGAGCPGVRRGRGRRCGAAGRARWWRWWRLWAGGGVPFRAGEGGARAAVPHGAVGVPRAVPVKGRVRGCVKGGAPMVCRRRGRGVRGGGAEVSVRWGRARGVCGEEVGAVSGGVIAVVRWWGARRCVPAEGARGCGCAPVRGGACGARDPGRLPGGVCPVRGRRAGVRRRGRGVRERAGRVAGRSLGRGARYRAAGADGVRAAGHPCGQGFGRDGARRMRVRDARAG